MNEYRGVTDGHSETGTEGMWWCICEDGKTGYDGLVLIAEGDHLTVTNPDGATLFDGDIVWDTTTGYESYPLNPSDGQQAALGFWVHWIQAGWRPDDWAGLFLPGEKNRGVLKRACPASARASGGPDGRNQRE